MILYRSCSVLGPPLQPLQSRLQSADLMMTGGKNLYKHNPQMLIFTSLINIKIDSSLTTMWRHCFTVRYADSAVCSVQAGVSLCRLTSSQLRCRGCTAAGPRNHWRAGTSECTALTRVTELPRIGPRLCSAAAA